MAIHKCALLYFTKSSIVVNSHKTGESAGIILGVDIDMLYAAYIYDFGFSNIARYSTGSHEIVLAYKLFPSRTPKFGPRDWGFRAK